MRPGKDHKWRPGSWRKPEGGKWEWPESEPGDWKPWDKTAAGAEHWREIAHRIGRTGSYGGAHSFREHTKPWRRRGRSIFLRFVIIFGLMTLLITGGMYALAYLLTHYFGGGEGITMVVWMAGCGLALALPIMGAAIGVRALRGIANPLGEIMEAADAVANGDLSVRVEEGRRGEFGKLARSFNRMTEELDRAETQRRNLTADVAHELRTPLHIILGNLEGLVDGVYRPEPEFMENILEETRRLSRLVSDLQTLAMAESGQLPMTFETVEAGELLADVGTSFSGQAESAGITLETLPVEPEGLSFKGDIGRLTQVLSNLVANALRHTPAGGRITLSAHAAELGVQLIVADSGEGISAEDLPHIFDRFWRGDRARTHIEGGGGGLGLAIARQLVRNHGGTIRVESAVGQGAIFTIDLPLTRPKPVYNNP